MSAFYTGVICLCITAAFAYINKRFIGLPTTIGVMFVALMMSIVLIGLNALGFESLLTYERQLLGNIDFADVLMDIMLSMLLFAGALHVKATDLRAHKWRVGMLAVVGTLLSTVIVAMLTYYLLGWLGLDVALIWCFLFGALISPTDPIAVMGILKSVGAPKSVETVISGESLFNDGIGVVVFAALLEVLRMGTLPSTLDVIELFALEAGGGLLFGFVLGWSGYRLLKSIDSYQEEVLITLALVLGGYSLASYLHLSGPLAMVMTGLLLGNKGRAHAMSDQTQKYVDSFWELIDEILNALLFVLLGLEVVTLTAAGNVWWAALGAIVIALLARLIAVKSVMGLLRQDVSLPKGTWKVLVWGGLRGGISVALVLSLPDSPERNILLTMTYAIVLFSIIVQGMTVGKLAKNLSHPDLPNL